MASFGDMASEQVRRSKTHTSSGSAAQALNRANVEAISRLPSSTSGRSDAQRAFQHIPMQRWKMETPKQEPWSAPARISLLPRANRDVAKSKPPEELEDLTRMQGPQRSPAPDMTHFPQRSITGVWDIFVVFKEEGKTYSRRSVTLSTVPLFKYNWLIVSSNSGRAFRTATARRDQQTSRTGSKSTANQTASTPGSGPKKSNPRSNNGRINKRQKGQEPSPPAPPRGSPTMFHELRFGCPFSKRDRDYYLDHPSTCTFPPGMPDISRVTEHLKRYHWGNENSDLKESEHLEEGKRIVYARFSKRSLQSQGESWRKWKELYCFLFECNMDDTPSPYYDYYTATHRIAGRELPVARSQDESPIHTIRSYQARISSSSSPGQSQPEGSETSIHATLISADQPRVSINVNGPVQLINSSVPLGHSELFQTYDVPSPGSGFFSSGLEVGTWNLDTNPNLEEDDETFFTFSLEAATETSSLQNGIYATQGTG